MNNIIDEVNELKDLILDSEEYINYKKNLELIESNDEINELINKITDLQKEIVRLKHSKKNTTEKEKELDELYVKLDKYEIYLDYIDSSKKLNELLTKIQSNFQEFFDSLVS